MNFPTVTPTGKSQDCFHPLLDCLLRCREPASFSRPSHNSTGLPWQRKRHCLVTNGCAGSMACPALEERHPGLGAVVTPRNGRGVETMETKMTKKPRRSPKSLTTSETKAKAAGPRGRQRPQTKKKIALSLLQRSKGASIAEMQDAMDWQAHSVRGFLAGTVKKMPGVILLSQKPESGPRRYRVESAGA